MQTFSPELVNERSSYYTIFLLKIKRPPSSPLNRKARPRKSDVLFCERALWLALRRPTHDVVGGLLVLTVVRAEPCLDEPRELVTNDDRFLARLDRLLAVQARAALALKDLFRDNIRHFMPPWLDCC